ncbi:hypothetical protein FE257_010080 [Aspergillus nanangensis]|uniref:Uncharacterized protein n=1 Tax=Aspergillus nanangensis TaxID=2582783 RepID=A0AAD4GSC3_ASPNN|nr:hypothetical protein FE257_010080 [Aspergillus nanangensis]
MENEQPETPRPQINQDPRTLTVNFSWKKWKTLISYGDQPGSEPAYIMESKTFKRPNLIFKSGAGDSTIGTATLHSVGINPDFEIHGSPGALTAKSRLLTDYIYISKKFNTDGRPMTMTWTSGSAFKSFDFVLLMEDQLPVAKFTSRTLALKNMGKIEFLDSRSDDPAVRDEIVVTGLTLFFCMIYRASNFFNLVGAAIYRPGHETKKATQSAQQIQVDEAIQSATQPAKHDERLVEGRQS